jgi:TPR repeat protein
MAQAMGLDGPPDENAAAGWFERLADSDVILARRSQLGLGRSLLEGGGPDRAAEAWRWIARAASLDDPAAAEMMAAALEPGGALPEDAGVAYDWRLRAEDARVAECHRLGTEAELAGKISGDPFWTAEAARLHGEAAACGHAGSQMSLALRLLSLNLPDEAVPWVRWAADSGLPQARNLLGALYRSGLGVPQDFGEAVRWIRLAAEAGLAEAQYDLAMILLTGDGGPRDKAEGASWLRKAMIEGQFSPPPPGGQYGWDPE